MTGSEPKPGGGRSGILLENRVAALALGLFPSIAVTTHTDYALALSGGVLFVLVGWKLVAGIIATVIPEKVRFLAQLFVISALVTVVDQAARVYASALSQALGIYVPLIAVNCLVLGGIGGSRNRNSVGKAVLDGLGIGAGFALGLTIVALVREALGSGTITLFPLWGWNGIVKVPGLVHHPIGALALPAGAFLVVAYLAALANWVGPRREGRPGRHDGRTSASSIEVGRGAGLGGPNAPESIL